MNVKLEAAIHKLSALPEDEQDAIADWLLAELDDESRWGRQFAADVGLLQRMADEALEEYVGGETRPIPGVDA